MLSFWFSDIEEWEEEELHKQLSVIDENIEEWKSEGVYSGDQGFQDMLGDRDTIITEIERRGGIV